MRSQPSNHSIPNVYFSPPFARVLFVFKRALVDPLMRQALIFHQGKVAYTTVAGSRMVLLDLYGCEHAAAVRSKRHERLDWP